MPMSYSSKFLIINLNPVDSTLSLYFSGYSDTPRSTRTVSDLLNDFDHRLVYFSKHSSNPVALQNRLTSYPITTGVAGPKLTERNNKIPNLNNLTNKHKQ